VLVHKACPIRLDVRRVRSTRPPMSELARRLSDPRVAWAVSARCSQVPTTVWRSSDTHSMPWATRHAHPGVGQVGDHLPQGVVPGADDRGDPGELVSPALDSAGDRSSSRCRAVGTGRVVG
jgi:hypothetical protein